MSKTPNIDANKTFSQAVQLHDSNIAWGFPPILDSIEKIINQMIHQLQETWSEKLIREMRSLVSRLQHIQFQNTNPKYFPPESKYEEFGHHLRRVVQDFSKETLNPDDEVMVKARAPRTVYST